ncbi:MAG TPA: hypothetical protein VFZ61_32195, partial [Polyangiales bacterium]
AQKMNVLALREIDAAWRRQDADAPSDSLKPVRGSLPSLFPKAEPTRHVRAKSGPFAAAPDGRDAAEAQPASVRSGRTEVWAWSAAVSLLVALVVVLAVTRLRPAGGEGVVYVEAQPAESQARAAASEPNAPAAANQAPAARTSEPVPAVTTPTARAPQTTPKLATSEHRLTERFAQRRADVSRCFREQAAEAPEQLALAFEVDPRGAVERAEIEPAALSETPLGACLLQVARATQFGPQSGYLRFRIPVNARAHKAP